MTVWINGAVVRGAVIDPSDRGFTLGDGLFETLRLTARGPLFTDRHLARLRHGAALLGIPVPFSDEAIKEGVAALIRATGIDTGSVRVTLTRGPGPRGVLPPSDVRPTLIITLAPPPPQFGPVRIMIASVTRRNEFSPLCGIKSLNYLDNILARREAAQHGFDDAILRNTQGRVAETSIANLFAVIDGQLLTPPTSEGVLPGIARGLLLERCGGMVRPLSVEDLRRASEIILTSALGIRPVTALESQEIGMGPVAGTLAAAIAEP